MQPMDIDIDVSAVEEDLRHMFFPKRCARCRSIYVEGMGVGAWACAQHVGAVHRGAWTCCGTNIYAERTGITGCVPLDHAQALYRIPRLPPAEYSHDLFKYIEHNFVAHSNRNRAPGGDLDGLLYVYTVDNAALDIALFNVTYGYADGRQAKRARTAPHAPVVPAPHATYAPMGHPPPPFQPWCMAIPGFDTTMCMRTTTEEPPSSPAIAVGGFQPTFVFRVRDPVDGKPYEVTIDPPAGYMAGTFIDDDGKRHIYIFPSWIWGPLYEYDGSRPTIEQVDGKIRDHHVHFIRVTNVSRATALPGVDGLVPTRSTLGGHDIVQSLFNTLPLVTLHQSATIPADWTEMTNLLNYVREQSLRQRASRSFNARARAAVIVTSDAAVATIGTDEFPWIRGDRVVEVLKARPELTNEQRATWLSTITRQTGGMWVFGRTAYPASVTHITPDILPAPEPTPLQPGIAHPTVRRLPKEFREATNTEYRASITPQIVRASTNIYNRFNVSVSVMPRGGVVNAAEVPDGKTAIYAGPYSFTVPKNATITVINNHTVVTFGTFGSEADPTVSPNVIHMPGAATVVEFKPMEEYDEDDQKERTREWIRGRLDGARPYIQTLKHNIDSGDRAEPGPVRALIVDAKDYIDETQRAIRDNKDELHRRAEKEHIDELESIITALNTTLNSAEAALGAAASTGEAAIARGADLEDKLRDTEQREHALRMKLAVAEQQLSAESSDGVYALIGKWTVLKWAFNKISWPVRKTGSGLVTVMKMLTDNGHSSTADVLEDARAIPLAETQIAVDMEMRPSSQPPAGDLFKSVSRDATEVPSVAEQRAMYRHLYDQMCDADARPVIDIPYNDETVLTFSPEGVTSNNAAVNVTAVSGTDFRIEDTSHGVKAQANINISDVLHLDITAPLPRISHFTRLLSELAVMGRLAPPSTALAPTQTLDVPPSQMCGTNACMVIFDLIFQRMKEMKVGKPFKTDGKCSVDGVVSTAVDLISRNAVPQNSFSVTFSDSKEPAVYDLGRPVKIHYPQAMAQPTLLIMGQMDGHALTLGRDSQVTVVQREGDVTQAYVLPTDPVRGPAVVAHLTQLGSVPYDSVLSDTGAKTNVRFLNVTSAHGADVFRLTMSYVAQLDIPEWPGHLAMSYPAITSSAVPKPLQHQKYDRYVQSMSSVNIYNTIVTEFNELYSLNELVQHSDLDLSRVGALCDSIIRKCNIFLKERNFNTHNGIGPVQNIKDVTALIQRACTVQKMRSLPFVLQAPTAAPQRRIAMYSFANALEKVRPKEMATNPTTEMACWQILDLSDMARRNGNMKWQGVLNTWYYDYCSKATVRVYDVFLGETFDALKPVLTLEFPNVIFHVHPGVTHYMDNATVIFADIDKLDGAGNASGTAVALSDAVETAALEVAASEQTQRLKKLSQLSSMVIELCIQDHCSSTLKQFIEEIAAAPTVEGQAVMKTLQATRRALPGGSVQVAAGVHVRRRENVPVASSMPVVIMLDAEDSYYRSTQSSFVNGHEQQRKEDKVTAVSTLVGAGAILLKQMAATTPVVFGLLALGAGAVNYLKPQDLPEIQQSTIDGKRWFHNSMSSVTITVAGSQICFISLNTFPDDTTNEVLKNAYAHKSQIAEPYYTMVFQVGEIIYPKLFEEHKSEVSEITFYLEIDNATCDIKSIRPSISFPAGLQIDETDDLLSFHRWAQTLVENKSDPDNRYAKTVLAPTIELRNIRDMRFNPGKDRHIHVFIVPTSIINNTHNESSHNIDMYSKLVGPSNVGERFIRDAGNVAGHIFTISSAPVMAQSAAQQWDNWKDILNGLDPMSPYVRTNFIETKYKAFRDVVKVHVHKNLQVTETESSREITFSPGSLDSFEHPLPMKFYFLIGESGGYDDKILHTSSRADTLPSGIPPELWDPASYAAMVQPNIGQLPGTMIHHPGISAADPLHAHYIYEVVSDACSISAGLHSPNGVKTHAAVAIVRTVFPPTERPQ